MLYYFISNISNIRFTASAQFPGSSIVRTGTLLGIWRVDWILTSMSVLSLNGGHAITGTVVCAATTPDKAFDLLNKLNILSTKTIELK